MTGRPSGLLTVLATTSLLLLAAGCGSDDDDEGADTDAAATTADTAAAATTPDGTEATEPTEETAADTTTGDADEAETTEGGGGGEAWAVATEECIEPARGQRADRRHRAHRFDDAALRRPCCSGVGAGRRGVRAYMDYANEQGLLPEHDLELAIGDDQYNATMTPNVVNGLLDDGVHLFSGIIGTPNNDAVRDLLNEECVPQMLALSGSPAVVGEVTDYPWTTGALITGNIESQAYAQHIADQFPDGATAALFTVANDYGEVYRTAFDALAEELGIEIVDEQTIEAADSAPPSAQLNSIAGNQPDVILAVPLGAQCPTFMTELANAKAAQSGWDPQVYITNSCANPNILAVAGEAANGLLTSRRRRHPRRHQPGGPGRRPDVQAYIDYMTNRGNADIVATAALGWNTGDVTVEILRRAAESPEGLTRGLDHQRRTQPGLRTKTLPRDGVEYKMSGEDDAFYGEDVQIIQYDAATGFFVDVDDLITTFRSS